jgi:pimeloyl-ACP methyl ester carboxylesterase
MELHVDGKAVFAADGGRPFKPEQPTVIFVHGAGFDHTVWTLQSRYFAHHGRNVVVVDLPGHGRSAGPALASIIELAEWLVRLIEALRVAQAAVVGHSMGGLIALETAARHPARVWALALLGVGETMRVHPALLESAAAGAHLAAELVTDWGFGRSAHIGGYRAPGIWMLGAGMRVIERNAGALGIDLKACNDYGGASAAGAKIRCPTIVLAGESDRMTPLAAARALAARIDGARLVTIPRAGHMMMIEQPDATLEALAEAV